MLQSSKSLKPLLMGMALGVFAFAPAHGQDGAVEFPHEVPAAADMLLWCSSAFHMLAIASQEDADTQNFLAARTILTERAAEILFEADYPEDQLVLLAESYDERVASDFETGAELPFSADQCLDALDIEGL